MPPLPDAGKESDTERNGFLSYAAEWHAVAIGAFFGVVYGVTGEPAVAMFAFMVITGKAKVSNRHLRDAAREAAYSGGAFAVFAALSPIAAAFV